MFTKMIQATLAVAFLLTGISLLIPTPKAPEYKPPEPAVYDWETHKHYEPKVYDSIIYQRRDSYPKWIKLTEFEKRRAKRDLGITEQDVRDIVEDELYHEND